MQELVALNMQIKRIELSRHDALKLFLDQKESYKVEILSSLLSQIKSPYTNKVILLICVVDLTFHQLLFLKHLNS